MSRVTGPKEQSFSLPSSFRLHHRSDFLRFFEGSTVARPRHCVVFRVPNTSGHFRLGVTFKIRCSSVERNALRRRIRESFRLSSASLGSFDYNVVIRSWRSPMKQHAQALAKELLSGLAGQNFQVTRAKS